MVKNKKPKFQFGTPPSMTGGGQPTGGQMAGSVMQGLGGIVSMIPGWGTAVGMGLAGVGSILQATSAPKMTTPVNYNTSPYGYAMGGSLNPLAKNSFEVNAHQPNKIDSVDMGSYKLDDKEVVVGSGVFSNSLKNPVTNNTFAKDAKTVQQSLGRYQKSKAKTADYEFQDQKHLANDTNKMFEMQEKLATALGLRNQDGTPVQDGKNGFRWGGMKNKPGYQYGIPPTDNTIDYGQTISPYNIDSVLPPQGPAWNNTGLDLPGFGLNQTQPTFDPERPVGFTMKPLPPYTSIPEMGPPYNLAEDLNASDRNLYNQPSPTLPPPSMVGMSSPAKPSKFKLSDMFKSNLSPEEQAIRDEMDRLHPYGNAATAIGAGVSAASIMVNKPFYVKYGELGQPEIAQQNKALRRVVEGEKSALQDASNASRSAMAELENRSLQSRNANLRNIATGEIEAKNKIRGQFAGMEANARMQVGQRRTAIQQANLQKAMYQDDINTREYDTLQKENMKALMNNRELAIEKQNVMNQVRRDEILKGLLQSRDFKWDNNAGIVMKALGVNLPEGTIPQQQTSSQTQQPAPTNNNKQFLAWLGALGKLNPNLLKQIGG